MAPEATTLRGLKYVRVLTNRPTKFGNEATDLLTASGMKPRRISPASPWQSEVSERWIGNWSRELLDHLIVLSEPHLNRLIRVYV